MKIKAPYKVKCENCGMRIPLYMDLECIGSYERRMGPEMEHVAFYDDRCPECGEEIMVKIEAWEYPEGQLNDCYVTMEGACEIEDPIFVSAQE